MICRPSITRVLACAIVALSCARFAAADEPTTKPAEAAGAAAPAGKLKVGVLISQFTATGPTKASKPYGYDHARIADELKHASIELIPVIEPESKDDADQANILKEKFPDFQGTPITGDDVEALKSLSVLVLARVPNLKDEVLDAISKAADDGGVGLLVIGRCGNLTPGYKSQAVRDLVGLSAAQFAWGTGSPAPAEIVAADDPLLAPLKDRGEWKVMATGAIGTPKEGVKPLVKLQSLDSLKFPGDSKRIDTNDYLLVYQATLGKGPIIVCNWTELPDVLKDLGEESFYVRCVRRLAELKKG